MNAQEVIDFLIENLKDNLDLDEIEDLTIVDSSFEQGGRWSNFEETIVEYKGIFIEVSEEVPATEQQEGGDFTTTLREVAPQEVVKVIFRGVPNGASGEFTDSLY